MKLYLGCNEESLLNVAVSFHMPSSAYIIGEVERTRVKAQLESDQRGNECSDSCLVEQENANKNTYSYGSVCFNHRSTFKHFY
jgi:hypothetical protein